MERYCLVAFFVLSACAHRPWEEPGPAWKRVASEHFVIQTDSSPETYEPMIDRLEAVHAALSKAFFRGLEAAPFQVLLLDRRRDFEALAIGGARGFFAPGIADG